MSNTEQIVDQFTRQAAQFAQSAPARSEDIVERILRLAQPGPEDVALDVACGPGLLVCDLARTVCHATGIDLTPAMLQQARKTQQERKVSNVSWDQGDVTALPYSDRAFDIVTCRFAFHHFPQPLPVLREMKRVCRPGGRIVIADSAPLAAKADAFNQMERLRDPSHSRALPVEEWLQLFAAAGLPQPQVERTRLGLDLDEFLARSYPREGDEARIRVMFENALGSDGLDIQPRRDQSRIHFSIPVAILAVQIPYGA
ncbi:MAG TPA: methyltransferase domain-containing protein [Acidobacteriaceae bacterium]|jgi:ubiquinone/menaquinone biosynthesis C-methylase UbiE|nr:methyltransferase domain-containing protein [Acidobacteriaceae bacterium]